jgi:hypothetical protein
MVVVIVGWRFLKAGNADLFATPKLRFEKALADPACMVREETALYEVRPAKRRLE